MAGLPRRGFSEISRTSAVTERLMTHGGQGLSPCSTAVSQRGFVFRGGVAYRRGFGFAVLLSRFPYSGSTHFYIQRTNSID